METVATTKPPQGAFQNNMSTPPPSPLPHITDFTALVQSVVSETNHSIVFLIDDGGQPRILKTFKRLPRPKSFRKSKKSVRKSKKSFRRHDNPPEGFLRETIAYKHLRGFHSDSILQCYATLKIQEPSKRLTTISSEVRVIIEELPSPTYAVLLEYLPDAQILSPENITEEISNQLCETLSVFHKIGISHGDPYPRNILVSHGRVVWIDFDCSRMGRAAEFLEREADDFKEGICNNLLECKKDGDIPAWIYFGW